MDVQTRIAASVIRQTLIRRTKTQVMEGTNSIRALVPISRSRGRAQTCRAISNERLLQRIGRAWTALSERKPKSIARRATPAQGRAGARRQGKGRRGKAPHVPPGGQLKQDYTFQWASAGRLDGASHSPSCSAARTTLLLYSWMYGPNWDKPFPSCTSLMDGFDRAWYSVGRTQPSPRSPRRPSSGSARGAGSADGHRSLSCPGLTRRSSGGLPVPGAGATTCSRRWCRPSKAGRTDCPVPGRPRAMIDRVGTICACSEPLRLHAGGAAGPITGSGSGRSFWRRII